MFASATVVPAVHRCPRCGAAFDCGAPAAASAPAGAEAPLACWCAALPVLARPLGERAAAGPAALCLCPGCLADALAGMSAGQPGPTE